MADEVTINQFFTVSPLQAPFHSPSTANLSTSNEIADSSQFSHQAYSIDAVAARGEIPCEHIG